jgi:hypothetical protein
MVFLNLHVESGLKHTMVLQLSYGVFWIERIEVFYYLMAYYNPIILYHMSKLVWVCVCRWLVCFPGINLKNLLDFLSFSFVAEFHSNKFSEFNRACCSNISLYLTKYRFTWAQLTSSFLRSWKYINHFIMLYGVIFWRNSTNKENVYIVKC